MPTHNHTVTENEWTEIGSGPMLIYVSGAGSCDLHFSLLQPDADAAFVNLTGTAGFSYGQNEKCFARANDGDCVITVIHEEG